MSGADVRESLERVLARLEAAARRAGRDASEVTLIGVTKTVPVERILAAAQAGLRHVGENRVQEAASKFEALRQRAPDLTWHLVGHLQSNKAGRAAGLFSWVHSLDRQELARRLERHAAERGAPIRVLLQVDLGHEATKHGVDPARLAELASETARLGHLQLRGLMTLPPLFEDPEASRPYFRQLRRLRDELAARGCVLPDLSMGMSNDFEVAVEEGATLVRVGRALFGERDRRA